jgi:hypothetical protein
MTQPDDHGRDMTTIWLADDDAIEAIVRGDEVDSHLLPLAAFARGVRVIGDEQVPAASAALSALFATGAESKPVLGNGRKRLNGSGAATAFGKVAGLSLLAKIGLGTSVAAATVASAGAAGVLPEPARDAVRGAIEAVSSVEFDDSDPAAPDHPVNFGDRVSDDATGESDGEKGVDGQEIRDETPGADNRPSSPGNAPAAPPGQTGETGHDRADDTPAADHLPDAPGGGQNTPPSTVPECGPPHADGATPSSTVPPARGDNGGPC